MGQLSFQKTIISSYDDAVNDCAILSLCISEGYTYDKAFERFRKLTCSNYKPGITGASILELNIVYYPLGYKFRKIKYKDRISLKDLIEFVPEILDMKVIVLTYTHIFVCDKGVIKDHTDFSHRDIRGFFVKEPDTTILTKSLKKLGIFKLF